MAENLAKRITRLLSATVQDAVDRMEAANSDSVMREAIREVDRVIDLLQSDYEKVAFRRLQAVRHQKMQEKKWGQLHEKARFAVAENREDLAEAALNYQVDLERESCKLDNVVAECQEEEKQLAENLEALKIRKSEMEQALNNFQLARRAAQNGPDAAPQKRANMDKRVQDAEETFDRAMAGAGGVGFSRMKESTIQQVAEIDVLYKRTTVAERLAALKLENASSH